MEAERYFITVNRIFRVAVFGACHAWGNKSLIPRTTKVSAILSRVEHHIGWAFQGRYPQHVVDRLGTITKCLKLRHFQHFPQIDARTF